MKVEYLVINYRVTMEERATRYRHAKACHVTRISTKLTLKEIIKAFNY